MRYVGETKDEEGNELCFFAAHYSPPVWYCFNTAATRHATIKDKNGKVLQKDLPLCGACVKVITKLERGLGHTVRIQKI